MIKQFNISSDDKCHIITADGGFDFSDDYINLER